MTKHIIPKNNIHRLEDIVAKFAEFNISLHPAGIWKWDTDRKKIAIDANRTDGLPLAKYPKDTILKHRAELSGVCVIDCDGVPLDWVDDKFPSSVDTFYTTTSSHKKQHRYIYPPVGKTFPESRVIKDLHPDLDILTNGIIFEAHDYKSEKSEFSMNNSEIKRCTMKEYDLICSILEPKTKAPKQTKYVDNDNPIIAKFNKAHSCEEMLMAQGYIKIHDRLLHPDSKSGIAGVIIFDDGCVYSHGSDWLNDKSSHDAFDIYAHYMHDGDKGLAMAGAREVLDLNYYGFEKASVDIDKERLRFIKSQIAFDEDRSKFYMVNTKGKLVKCGRKDLWSYIERTFPPFYNKEHNVSEDSDDFDKALKSIKNGTANDIMINNSFSKMDRRIDPFAKENHVKLVGSTFTVVTYRLFPNVDMDEIKYDYKTSMAVYNDFKDHFKELPKIIDMLVASRFGGDRKKCFLYTQMVSDFGKSFLGKALRSLGLLVNIKESELKKALSGDPVGIMVEEFETAWILFFDEFKSAIGEIKDITHTMTLAPKNQQRAEVQLYTKWFASAETSESLVGNGGVDKQFANRFAMIDTGTERITNRAMYRKDNNAYLKALTYALYVIIKRKSDSYIALGEVKAGIASNKVVDKFRSEFEMKATLDENAEDLIDEIFEYLDDTLIELETAKIIPMAETDIIGLTREAFVKHEGGIYLRQANRCNLFFDEYIKMYYGKDNYRKMSHKKRIFRNHFVGREERSTLNVKDKAYNVYQRSIDSY